MFIINHTLSPEEILVSLIRYDNPSLIEATPDQFKFRNAKPISSMSREGIIRDTSIEFTHQITGSEIVDCWVELKYRRIELDVLFTEIIAAEKNWVHELEVPVMGDDGLVDIDLFMALVKAKYGLDLAVEQKYYDIVRTAWNVTISATADNPSLSRSISFVIKQSLERRVDIKSLEGFNAIHPNVDIKAITDSQGRVFVDTDGRMITYDIPWSDNKIPTIDEA